jgi:hypothetical protein
MYPLLKAEYINQINYPSDSNGKVCGYDIPSKPYLNFTDAPLIVPSSRLRQQGYAWPSVPATQSPVTVLLDRHRYEWEIMHTLEQSSYTQAGVA